MAITAAMVKELRDRTGAGMMECKKALVSTDGDLDAAVEALRKSGLAKADKKASRVAAEGRVVLAQSASGNEALLLEVNCETDFVAKDENFLRFADKAAEIALATGPADTEELLGMPFEGQDSVEDARQALILKIGENVQIRRFVRVNSNGFLGAYVHGGRIGVLVGVDGGDAALAKDLAMHIAAISPAYVSADDVPAEYLDKEREILQAQAEDSGKPAEIVAKMVEGRLRKHLAEITLLGQPFVKDPDTRVDKLLQQHGAKVESFVRLVVGEGIEKRETDFAEEVRQQAQGG